MFSFPLLAGGSKSILKDPKNIVITPEMATKYFGENNPLGEMIMVQLGETLLEFTVSGVIEEAPANSSIQYDFLISTELLKYTIPKEYLQSWDIILFSTFIQLTSGLNAEQLGEKITGHMKRLLSEYDFGDISFHLQPVTDIHLNPNYEGEMIASSNPVYSYILGVIALAILLIACMNFVILTIGRSANRARGVGLRKVLGARRGQIMRQFWGEAFLQSFLALILSIALIEALLPTFNDLAQKQLSFEIFSDVSIFPILLVTAVITSFLAGSYPALFLSRLLPAIIFRGGVKPGGKNRLIRGLVILQFSVSIFLTISTLIMSSQIDYVNKTNLGFNKDFVVTFPTGTEGKEAANLLERFRIELSKNSEVLGVTGYSYAFGESWLYLSTNENNEMTMLIGEDITGPGYSDGTSDAETYFYLNWVDADYIPTLGINMEEGRNFIAENSADQNGAVIINRAAAIKWGLDNPIGQKCPTVFDDAIIVGVTEDFHYFPLQREIEQLVLHMFGTSNLSSVYQIAVKINGGDIPATLAMLEQSWKMVTDGKPFNYSFLDENIIRQYLDEQRWYRIIKYAFILSMFITCLGLFGLVSLSVAKKTKEIGVRKVLGADIASIVKFLLLDFMVLVLAANMISWPVAYYVMNKWLENFAYRIEMGWVVFVLSASIALTIALLTISVQAIKAARANPVETLRYE
jgi:putative ABC transport system permease protein